MDTRIDEIAERIYRISTYFPGVGGPGGLTFNQFLLDAEEALLYHTGMPALFPAVRDAVGRVLDPRRIRWISSGHASRPDEFGALNQWLAVAPGAEAIHGAIACFVNLSDLADRPPRPIANDAILEIGGRRLRFVATPHVPGPREAGVWYEEVTSTLFCGDLFSQEGNPPPLSAGDIVDAAIDHDARSNGTALTPSTGATLRRLAGLQPGTLALMHGPAHRGDGAGQLQRLAAHLDARLREAFQDVVP